MFNLYVNNTLKSKHLDYRQAWKQFTRQKSYGNDASIYHDDHLCASSKNPDDLNDKPEDYCDGP